MKLQNYLTRDSDLNLQEKKDTFLIRSRMTSAKCNFRNLISYVNCVACDLNGKHIEETQEHIVLCENLSQNDSKLKLSKEMFS